MGEKSLFPRSIFGRVFAEGFVAALMESPVQAARTLEALEETGLRGMDVRVLPGELALEIDASHHPSLAMAASAAGEALVSEEFVAGALLGDVLVGVRASSETSARAAWEILATEGATVVRHFGPGSVLPIPDPFLKATA